MPANPTSPLSTDRLSKARAPLDRAWTLPSAAFTEAETYSREIDAVMKAEWLCVGRTDQIPAPGDYRTLDLLDERLVLVRDDRGEVRVLSRICRHRGAEVAAGSGNTRFFQCPYHAWAFELDGRLKGAPHSDTIEGFDPASCRLPSVRSEIWEGWIFVNLSGDAEELGPQLAPLSERLANYRMSEMVAVEAACFDSPFNWKVLTDNFMEAYHHIATHRNTLQPIYPAAASHVIDSDGPYSLLVMPAKPGSAGAPSLPEVGPLDDEDRNVLLAGSVFPTHLFAPSRDFLTWYQILPEGVDRFTLRIYVAFPKEVVEDPAKEEAIEGAKALIRAIHNEDIGACETVWRGLQTPSFEEGRLSTLEKAIWQFNQWWIERMESPA